MFSVCSFLWIGACAAVVFTTPAAFSEEMQKVGPSRLPLQTRSVDPVQKMLFEFELVAVMIAEERGLPASIRTVIECSRLSGHFNFSPFWNFAADSVPVFSLSTSAPIEKRGREAREGGNSSRPSPRRETFASDVSTPITNRLQAALWKKCHTPLLTDVCARNTHGIHENTRRLNPFSPIGMAGNQGR